MTTAELQALLDTHDDGILRHGFHKPGREFCALEFESKVRGRAWSDIPITLPDLRPLNDARWTSDKARTAALLPVMVALWDWKQWTSTRRQAWATLVVIETVRQIISQLPKLNTIISQRCKAVTNLKEARAAAGAAAGAGAYAADAAYAATYDAAYAATDAARAAADAAYAAADAEGVLIVACNIWIKAAQDTE